MQKFRAFRRPEVRPARLTAGAHKITVQIRNVSRTGLRLAGAPDDIPPGALARVECGPVELTGQVRWRMGDKLGLSLVRPLSVSEAGFFGL